MRILVVEDHPLNRRSLRAQLEGEGATVLEAIDGVEAVSRLEQESVDAVISDILMPRMDGYRLCFELRTNPKWRALPFLFYTSNHPTPEDEEAGRELGADGFLHKSSTTPEIIAAVRAAVAQERSQPRPPALPPEDAEPLKLYNARLVTKLEERNRELEAAREKLGETNASLEARVLQRTEELEAVNRQLESFAYFVSHELRSPLRAVEGFVNIIRDEYGPTMPEEAQRMFGVVYKNTQRMGRLIEDLLRFAQLSRASVRRATVSTKTLVDSAISDLREEMGTRAVKFELGELPEVSGDAALLQVVFQNLISNALKFTRTRPEARIEIGSQVVDGERVWRVSDNGVGFDMKNAGKLFKPFERLHPVDKYEGSGVGLGIVRTIVQRHGGKVWVDAALDRGATFSFTLGAA